MRLDYCEAPQITNGIYLTEFIEINYQKYSILKEAKYSGSVLIFSLTW